LPVGNFSNRIPGRKRPKAVGKIKSIKNFLRCGSGNFAATIAICAVPLFGALSLGVDYAQIFQKKSELQELADAAALAVAKEMALANSKTLNVQSIAENLVFANYQNANTESLSVTAERNIEETDVEVSLSLNWQPFFAHYIDKDALPIVASSKAGFAGGRSSICVLGLDEVSASAVSVDSKSSVTANNCAIFSNSQSTDSIALAKNSTMTAEEIYTSGGYIGASVSYIPQPITDSPIVADPLASRATPPSTVCDHMNMVISSGTQTLNPGVYCGGLTVSDGIAELEPGIYVIKDGPLSVQGNATITGDHVGFFLTGAGAVFDFGVSTQARLTAPKSGTLSGLLFFEDPASSPDRVFTIRSKDAEKFEGTVYLPKGTFFIDKASRVGQLSKWTAIIAKRVKVGTGPQLQINSDYANSDVPVPEGIASKTQVRLLH
jgi:Flp pilus assembly protein TadG